VYLCFLCVSENKQRFLAVLLECSCALKHAVQAVRLGFPRNSQLLNNVTLRSTANFAEVGQEVWRARVEINFRQLVMCNSVSRFSQNSCLPLGVFCLRFIAEKVCTACSRTSYRIVHLTNSDIFLPSDTSETEVNINTSVNKGSKKF